VGSERGCIPALFSTVQLEGVGERGWGGGALCLWNSEKKKKKTTCSPYHLKEKSDLKGKRRIGKKTFD